MSCVQRQRQLSLTRPGTFMRASAPRFRRSCRGAIASAATDDHAIRINSSATSSVSPCAAFQVPPARICRCCSDNSANQPRVVLLSWVPVYTTVFGM